MFEQLKLRIIDQFWCGIHREVEFILNKSVMYWNPRNNKSLKYIVQYNF